MIPVSSKRSEVFRSEMLALLRFVVEMGDGFGFARESGFVDFGIFLD